MPSKKKTEMEEIMKTDEFPRLQVNAFNFKLINSFFLNLYYEFCHFTDVSHFTSKKKKN